METAVLEQQRRGQFVVSRQQARQRMRPAQSKRGNLNLKKFSNRARPQVQSVDTEQMYNTGASPETRAQREAENKARHNQLRNQERIKRANYKLPQELMTFIEDLAEPGQDFVKGMYEKELDNQGMNELLDQQSGKSPLQMTKQVLNREKAKLQKAATDAIKKQAQKMLKEAFKEGLKGGKQVFTKTFWSTFAQGSVVEVEGALWESWFGSGTVTGSYQAIISVLHNGKKLLGEKGVISIEPDPFKLPSQDLKDPKKIALSGGTNILIGIYDIFGLAILTPLYWLLLLTIIILAHALFILIMLPYVLPVSIWANILNFFVG